MVSLIPTRLDATARGQALAAVAALAGVVAVGLNAGQFARNQDLYGTPFGPDGEGAPHEIKYLNAAFGGPQLTSTSCATRPSRSPPRSVQ